MTGRLLPTVRSLRSLLMREIVAALAAVWIFASGFILFSTWYDVHHSYIDQLSLLANTVATVLDSETPTNDTLEKTLLSQRNPNYFVIVRSADKTLIRTENSPQELDGNGYWFLEKAVSPSGKIEVYAGLRRGELWEIVFSVALSSAAPMSLGVAATLFLLHNALRRGLRPLTSLSGQLAGRNPGALAPLPTKDTPEELVPVIDALNDLFLRLTSALDKERRFVADASHELRTPLTAIRAQLDTIDKSNLDEASLAALGRVRQGVDRAARLVSQLLALARADAEMLAPPVEVSVDGVLAAVASELYPQAVRAGKEIDLELSPVRFFGRPEDFEMMVGNLLENAIRHARTTVVMTCETIEGAARIIVEDDGPGVPAEEREALFERFRRGSKRADLSGAIQGAGLGLSIVSSVAQRLGAQVDLAASQAGGLRVTVVLRQAVS